MLDRGVLERAFSLLVVMSAFAFLAWLIGGSAAALLAASAVLTTSALSEGAAPDGSRTSRPISRDGPRGRHRAR
jgi:hypothetical protein